MTQPGSPQNQFGVVALILGVLGPNNPRIALAGMFLGAISIAAGIAVSGYYARLDRR